MVRAAENCNKQKGLDVTNRGQDLTHPEHHKTLGFQFVVKSASKSNNGHPQESVHGDSGIHRFLNDRKKCTDKPP